MALTEISNANFTKARRFLFIRDGYDHGIPKRNIVGALPTHFSPPTNFSNR